MFSPAGIEINKEKYPITGIDISMHTGKIDFEIFNEHKIDFIYMKATEGVDYLDKQFNKNAKKFNNPIIYTNESTYRKYIRGSLKTDEIWICSFSKSPKIDTKWIFWQHSHKGKLKGAAGWIDINTFNGSRKDWNEYLSH